jgi:hypothetical protein
MPGAPPDSAWTTCSLSGEPLRDGEVVACELGRLYNKQSVVEHLLALRGETQSEAVAYQVRARTTGVLARGSAQPRAHNPVRTTPWQRTTGVLQH